VAAGSTGMPRMTCSCRIIADSWSASWQCDHVWILFERNWSLDAMSDMWSKFVFLKKMRWEEHSETANYWLRKSEEHAVSCHGLVGTDGSIRLGQISTDAEDHCSTLSGRVNFWIPQRKLQYTFLVQFNETRNQNSVKRQRGTRMIETFV
jgi:hypothetical protein